MPKIKNFSERFNQDESINNDSNLSLIDEKSNDVMSNSIANKNQDEINFNLNFRDELNQNLAILESATGLNLEILINRILSNALLDDDDNFHLIKLFRFIIKEEKIKINEMRLKELENSKNQKLIEMKKLELETLAYALANR